MGFETIKLSQTAEHASITLDRPAVLNSISPEMVDELSSALDRLEENHDLRALVISGSGRAFCAGADLKAARSRVGAAAPERANEIFLEGLRDLFCRIERFPAPVIAAVNGLALAGGLELALCCDLVIAAAGAKFGDAHANYGLVPGGGSSVRLPRKIGPARAKYLLFTGDFLDAETLRDWGLVAEVVPDQALADSTAKLVGRLVEKSPLGLRRMKRMIDDGLEQPLAVALRHELALNAQHAGSFDRREGLAAFAEKRRPGFEGR